MFLDNLSASLLQLCNAENLSYERASERCKCSAKHFANIVRKQTYPSLNILENICIGFHETPDSLLRIREDGVSFRIPMPVIEVHVFPSMSGSPSFPACPQCGHTLEREYMAYCDCCGQCLSWDSYQDASIVIHP